MVKVIAHRGWWTAPEEQNTLVAFQRAFDAGIGVELDVRDCNHELVVAHDPPCCGDDPLFEEVLTLLGARDLPLAVNVKSCGLAPWFDKILVEPKGWYFFDVAPGDEPPYRKLGLPLYVRDDWAAATVLVVSHEVIHGIDPMPQWRFLKDRHTRDVHLVTDRVAGALEFFK